MQLSNKVARAQKRRQKQEVTAKLVQNTATALAASRLQDKTNQKEEADEKPGRKALLETTNALDAKLKTSNGKRRRSESASSSS